MLNQQHDQASSLREKIGTAENDKYEVDILTLPPRSEKHAHSKVQQKMTNQPGRIHIWITRMIVIAFIAILFFIGYYFSLDMKMDQKIKNEADDLINIIK